MNAPYICKHFAIEELMSKAVLQYCKERNLDPWRFLNPGYLRTLDQLWEDFSDGGSVIINDHGWGGNNQFRGAHFMGEYRGNPSLSCHPLFRGADITFTKRTAASVRKEILGFEPEYEKHHMVTIPKNSQYPSISEIEFGSKVTWLHIGCGTNTGGILLYAPIGP